VSFLNPDAVLFWRPTHIFPSSVTKINNSGIQTISYNNDDPFGPKVHHFTPWHHHFLWYWYLKCLPVFERNFFYRKINCIEAVKFGARHAEVLLPYFLPWKDKPITLNEEETSKYETDVVFVGYYESDGREKKFEQSGTRDLM